MGCPIQGAGAARQSIAQNPQFTTMSVVRIRKLDGSHLKQTKLRRHFDPTAEVMMIRYLPSLKYSRVTYVAYASTFCAFLVVIYMTTYIRPDYRETSQCFGTCPCE
jgi:hypothetical protein